MATETNPNLNENVLQTIQRYIVKALTENVDATYENIKKSFLEKLEQDKAKTIASIVIELEKRVSYSTREQEVVIKILKN